MTAPALTTNDPADFLSATTRRHLGQFYIGGAWVAPLGPGTLPVINPATEAGIARIPAGTAADIDRAVAAARAAFPAFAAITPAERLALLQRIRAAYLDRAEDIARAVVAEVGTPLPQARSVQAFLGLAHLNKLIEVMADYAFEWQAGSTRVLRDPIGVCGLITPWNVPLNQIATKVYPALAAGCTMVLKPSEVSPLNAVIFAEVMAAAGVPPGVFNLVQGAGPEVGEALAAHPDIDMISITGSTRAGIAVARTAALTVKRVAQELGGKSANLLLPDADFATAVPKGVLSCFNNTGQACSSPTRMLVPQDRLDEVCALAAETAAGVTVGDPLEPGIDLGPLVNAQQFDRVQAMIAAGMAEGARLVAGGPGRPAGLSRGYFVRPTVFADVTPEMRIAQEEIFGPVLSILTYRDLDEAVEIANGTVYGLAAYVQSADIAQARAIGRRLRAGRVHINYPEMDRLAPFGGFKQSGNGRENGRYGLDEFTELKALIGYGP